MTVKELKKEYFEKWRKEEPLKYIMWLIFLCGSCIPAFIGLIIFLSGINEKNIGSIFICLIIYAVMYIISITIASEQRKGFKKYLEENKDKIK